MTDLEKFWQECQECRPRRFGGTGLLYANHDGITAYWKRNENDPDPRVPRFSTSESIIGSFSLAETAILDWLQSLPSFDIVGLGGVADNRCAWMRIVSGSETDVTHYGYGPTRLLALMELAQKVKGASTP